MVVVERAGDLAWCGTGGVRANGAAELLTSCVPGNDGPEFYQRIGFRRTGDLDENDEIILALDLGVQRQSSIR